MDNANRAKQFAPFAALKGFEEELKQKENDAPEITDQYPVSVLASFNPEGKMVPVFFGFDGNRIKIDHIVCDWHGTWGSKYKCEITDEEYVKTIYLIYYKTNNEWKLKLKKTVSNNCFRMMT